MQHEALLYSLDRKITRKQLKNKEQISYDREKYKKLDDRVQEQNIWSLVLSEEDMHYRFSPIKPTPYIIYYIWNIELLHKKILGIVGPRKMSAYGKQIIETLFDEAVGYDMVTISGMAEGVDQLCHSLSCKHNIPTVAVLGWGLGWYSRREEKEIIKKIVDAWGLVISEYRLFEQPTIYTFPQRNRIIAGLADLLFLPEAGKKSWSLITVECAIKMKKPVYATPSSIFSPTSEGILHLIENGSVKPIVDLKNFLDHHFISKKISFRPQTMILLDDKEQSIVTLLSRNQWREMQEIISTTWLDIQESIQVLTMLEIKELVYQDIPGRYMLR